MRHILLAAGLVVVLGLAAHSVIGARPGCLTAEALARSGIVIEETLSADAPGLDRAKTVASEHFGAGGPGEVASVMRARISGTELAPGDKPLFLVELVRDASPRPLIGTEAEFVAEHGPIMVTAPCSVVAVSEAGDPLFTLTEHAPVESFDFPTGVE